MNKKNLFLIMTILCSLVFIGFLGEKGPIELFGIELNIWIYRAAWLIITLNYGRRYWHEKKLQMEQ